jgi:hypothetical protein
MSSAVSASSDASSSRDRILGFGNKRSFVRDDVAVGTKYLDTVRGVKLHCRYWRRVTDTDDEGDIKVSGNPLNKYRCLFCVIRFLEGSPVSEPRLRRASRVVL